MFNVKTLTLMFAVCLAACNTISRNGSSQLQSGNGPASFFRDFDFEYPTNDANPFWIYSARTTNGGASPACINGYGHAISAGERTSGSQSLKLTYQGTGFCPDTVLNAITVLPVSVFAGKHVTISSDMKLASDVAGGLAIFSQNGDGTSSNADASDSINWSNHDWQRISFDYSVPANASTVMLIAALSAQSISGSAADMDVNAQVYFDNLSIQDTENGQVVRGTTREEAMQPTPNQIGDLRSMAQSNVESPAAISRIAADLSDATFVGLGEATHGTAEFQKQKVALIKSLVADFGFRAVSFEDDMSYARALDSYVRGGSAPEGGLAKGFYYRWWKTDYVIDLLTWMRAYNSSHPNDRVHFYGFDIEGPERARDQLSKYLVSSTFSDKAQALSLLQSYSQKFASGDWSGAQTIAVTLTDWMKSHASSASDDESWATKDAELLVQVAVRKQSNGAARDSFMADNVDWISSHQQGAKIIVWAHNDHVQKTPGSMGGDLVKRHGNKYQAVGFAFNKGSFLRYNFNTNQLDNVTFKPASKISVDGIISRLEQDSVYLSPVALSSPKLSFLSGRPQRDSGSEGSDGYAVSVFPDRFDSLIYFAVSTPIVLQN